MATDLIRYDLLVQEAFRDIFRRVLTDVAAKGLPGEHHFLVTFRTGAPGVKISDRLRQAHPHDMTIVLQHQFWDLIVTDQGFSVGLSFKNVPEKLVVPFSSVTGFFDPSVNFGAEFTAEAEGAPGARPQPLGAKPRPRAADSIDSGPGGETPRALAPAKAPVRPIETKPVEARPIEPRPIESKPVEPRPVDARSADPKPRAAPVEKKAPDAKPAGPKAVERDPKPPEPTPPAGPKVVSIDAFRKKN